MQLIQVLAETNLADDPEATIYVARPWSADADAIVVSPAPHTTDPIEQRGQTFEYFIEASIALEFLDGLAASNDYGTASERQRCERLIRYAETDA